ncbi:hypothetical protein HNY73_004677 [Argiope bruennichi]|uniref:Uncharacterized protein n=1 Tax=Argiope bruennichi TaxID=94029 RepID=A0A8T0FPN4_ARGBR|nr:hypothetical protein HNY73_004677 [Argiope bruennichi]
MSSYNLKKKPDPKPRTVLRTNLDLNNYLHAERQRYCKAKNNYLRNCRENAVELSHIDIAVDVKLALAFFFWNPPLLMLIVAFPPLTDPVKDDFPMGDSTSVLPNTPHCLLTVHVLRYSFW